MKHFVTYDVGDPASRIATITLDSPHNRNALSRQLLDELEDSLARAATDDRLHGVLLRSSHRVFCAGADLAEARSGGFRDSSRTLLRIQRSILELPVPVVARIDGPVRAGGLGLVAACDIAVANEAATFAFTEAKLGLAPAVVSATVLPVMSRRSSALSFLTSGVFDGKAAEHWGLLTMSVPAAEIDDAVANVLDNLTESSRQGLVESKALLSTVALNGWHEASARLVETSSRLFESDDARRLMSQFLDKTEAAPRGAG